MGWYIWTSWKDWFAGMGPIFEAFLPGAESCVKIEDYSRKACLVLEKEEAFAVCF